MFSMFDRDKNSLYRQAFSTKQSQEPSLESKFLDALSCVMYSKNPGPYAICITEAYLKEPNIDKTILLASLEKHLIVFLQKNARNANREHLLQIIECSDYDKENEENNELIKLLKNQYGAYLPLSERSEINIEDYTPHQLINSNSKILIKVRVEGRPSGAFEPLSSYDQNNYEKKEIWKDFIKGRTFDDAWTVMIAYVRNGYVSHAMNLMCACLVNLRTAPVQLQLLQGIQTNMHIFLREDAETMAKRTILHLLAMCHLQDKKAASILRTLLTNFEPISDKLDQQDENGETALHTAIWYGAEEVAKVLIFFGANKTLANNKGKTPGDYAAKKTGWFLPRRLNNMLTVERNEIQPVEPLSNFFNDKKDFGQTIVGAIFRLLNINYYQCAAELLSLYVNDHYYKEKPEIIVDYLARVGLASQWKSFFVAQKEKSRGTKEKKDIPVAQDKNGCNVLSILACGHYSSQDEARAMIKLLETFLTDLDESTKEAIFEHKDKSSYTLIGNVICSQSNFIPDMLKFFIQQYPTCLEQSQGTNGKLPWQIIDELSDLYPAKEPMRQVIAEFSNQKSPKGKK